MHLMHPEHVPARRTIGLPLLALIVILSVLIMAAACSGDAGEQGSGGETASDAGEQGSGGETASDAGAEGSDAGTASEGGDQGSDAGAEGGSAVVLQEGAVARYLVQEQFADVDLPNDAIGETSDVEGAFTFDESGSIVSEESRIVMNAASLRSDASRRDNYLSRNAIRTGQYPEIVFVATGVSGLPWPLPSSGEHTFEIQGGLTVRDVTRPVTWEVTAAFDGAAVTGTAKTAFTFSEFEMDVPVLVFLLSVDDNIRLELDFTASH